MNKNILSEVSRMKEIMGLINEQKKNQQQTTGLVGRSDEEAKEKGVIVPSDCPDGGCYFYSDNGNVENGRLYKKDRKGMIKFANIFTEVLTYLKKSGVLGLRKTEHFGASMDPAQSRDLTHSVVNYATSGEVTGKFRKYFPDIQNREDALASLIIPWKPNANKVIYGLPLFSYDKNTVYVTYNGETSEPPGVTQVTDPKVSDDETNKG